jgi:Arc/MetJ-type ribon-helix-helix transcriptional regulator
MVVCQVMGARKVKTVFTAESRQVTAIRRLVKSGRYGSPSEFLREAIDDKLRRIRDLDLAAEVERYCADGHANEDLDLIAMQAFPED